LWAFAHARGLASRARRVLRARRSRVIAVSRPPARGARDELAKALAAHNVNPEDVLLRQGSSEVAWALVAAGRDATNEVNAMEVVRVRAGEIAALRIVPPTGSSSFADASYALEVRDLDGDGRADAALTVGWTRELKTKDACKGCSAASCTVAAGCMAIRVAAACGQGSGQHRAPGRPPPTADRGAR
jgi:hypothetical protein